MIDRVLQTEAACCHHPMCPPGQCSRTTQQSLCRLLQSDGTANGKPKLPPGVLSADSLDANELQRMEAADRLDAEAQLAGGKGRTRGGALSS